jgi:hypothetical protein
MSPIPLLQLLNLRIDASGLDRSGSGNGSSDIARMTNIRTFLPWSLRVAKTSIQLVIVRFTFNFKSLAVAITKVVCLFVLVLQLYYAKMLTGCFAVINLHEAICPY